MEEVNEQSFSPSNGKIKTFASPQVLAAILDDGSSEITPTTRNLSTNSEGENTSVVGKKSPTDFTGRESNSTNVEQPRMGLPGTPNRLEQDHSDQQQKCSSTIGLGSPNSCQTSNGKPAQTELKSRSHIIARNKVQVAVRSKPKTYAEIHAAKLKKENFKLALRMEFEKKDILQSNTHEAQGDRIEVACGSEYGQGALESGNTHNVVPTAHHTGQWAKDHLNSARYDEQQALDPLDSTHYSEQRAPEHLDSAHYSERSVSEYLDSSFQSHASVQLPSNQSLSHGSGRTSGIEHVYPLGQIAPLPPIHKGQGHGIQSAPPGMYSYIRNQPLVHHLGYFSDFEHVFSSTLPNSHFINQGNRKTNKDSKLRRFVSDPHLASNSKDKVKNCKVSYQYGYTGPQRRVDYKPYTLSDFKRLQEEKVENFGRSLGPNTGTDDHREKALRNFRQKEYGEEVRAQHSNMRKTWRRAPAQSTVHPSKKQAEDRRKAAINYSKTVPKPVTFKKSKDRDTDKKMQDSPGSDCERSLTVIELLKMRHEKEKDEIELIRKQLSAKIRQ